MQVLHYSSFSWGSLMLGFLMLRADKMLWCSWVIELVAAFNAWQQLAL